MNDMIPPLKYNADGLICAIAVDHVTNRVLMQAWMNAESLALTLETGEAHYWSRSRQSLWHKGATSGATQTIKDIRIDCDEDCVLLVVDQHGSGACHTGRASCFYRSVIRTDAGIKIEDAED